MEAINKAPSEAHLAVHLEKVLRTLKQPTKFEESTITALEAMVNVLSEKKPRFQLQLASQTFQKLSAFFGLTSGLHVIAAPSGHGKTMWAMNWAEETAKQGHQVLMISLEMTPEDLGARLLASETDTPLATFVRRELQEGKRRVLQEHLSDEKFQHLSRIHIDKFGDYDWVKIKPRLLDRMMRLKPKLVILDYIQMVSNSDEDDMRMSKVLGDIARELKLFADETDCAALVLSQLNRESIKDIKRAKVETLKSIPLSNDYIKESGGIVEAADSVQLVCMPQRLPNCPMHLKGQFQVTVDKSRRLGILGTVLLPFDYEKMRFL